MNTVEARGAEFERLYRRLLIAAIGIILISLKLGYFGFVTAPIGALCFVVSMFFGIIWLFSQLSLHSLAISSWISYGLTSIGTMGVLTWLLGSPQLYPFYFLAVVFFVGEMLSISLWQHWRLGSIPLVTLVVCFCLMPAILLHSSGVIASIEAGNPTHLRILLSIGANPNARDQNESALGLAVATKKLGITKLLLDYGADPNSTDDRFNTKTPALMRAVQNPDATIAQLLLNYGANPNAQDNMSETALFRAVRFDNITTTQVLINSGADINAKNSFGETALFSASNLETAKFLIAHDIDINVKDSQGRTALFKLVGNGNIDVLKVVLENGLSLEEQDNKGRTALFSAVDNNRRTQDFSARGQSGYDVVEFILHQGVDVNHRDNAGQTALDVARSHHYGDLIALLMSAGAK